MSQYVSGPKVAGIILAAGYSRRFGSNKLLYRVKGRSVIEWSIGAVTSADLWKTAIVTPQSKDLDAFVPDGMLKLVNEDAMDGIGASIVTGTRHFKRDADGILLLLGDQPLITGGDLRNLLNEFYLEPYQIVAGSVGGEIRNPIVFPSSLFDELLTLSGDRGARNIAIAHGKIVTRVEIEPSHLIDIDRIEDLIKIEKAC